MSRYDSDLPIPTYDEALAAASDHGSIGGGGGGDAAEENEALLARQSASASASASARWTRGGSSSSGSGSGSGGGGGGGGGGGSSGGRRMDGYRPPTVESVRSSIESSFLDEFASPSSSSRSSAESLQREMVQMDVLDAGGRPRGDGGHGWGRAAEEDGMRGLLRLSLSKRFSSVRSSLSAISFLSRNPFRGLRSRLPRLPAAVGRAGPCCARLDGAAMVAVYRLLAVLFALLVAYVLLATDVFSFRAALGSDYLGPFDPESVRNFAHREVDKARVRHWLDYLSSFDHLAGTEGDYVLAKYVQGQLASFGLRSERMRYDVYLNYPKPGGRRVWIAQPHWEAALEEPADAAGASGDAKKDHRRQNTMVFHGYSKSGSASGPVVFANYGSRDDFAALQAAGIHVGGAVVLMREGGTQPSRGLKVKAAQDRGAVGALLFADRATEGWDWPESAVQRGHVALSSWVVGDVLSPGLPAIPGSHQVPKANNKGLVNIPSLPLSYKDARPILDAIKGKGKIVNGTGSTAPAGELWSGSLASSPTVHLKNEQVERDRQPIWNVLGHVEGVDKLDEKIVLGSSRDAWCFGASDPNSGTAIMLEVARVFGKMMDVGWRPRRSVVFASWDGTQYNQVGPTEFVEEAGKAVGASVLAYVNLGAAVAGARFTASGSPALQSVLASVLGRVDHPLTHQPLNATWAAAHMPAPKAEGAHAPFQFHAGVSSLEIAFEGGKKRSPHHSCYDSFARVKDVLDPSFLHHEALARVVALLLVELADTDIAPLSMADYAHALANYTADLEAWVRAKETGAKKDGGKDEGKKGTLDLVPLTKAVATAQGHMAKFSGRKEAWMDRNAEGSFVQNDDWAVANRRSRSQRMGNFDKHLADAGSGLPARGWFKHAIFSPRAWGGPGASYFPSIRDAVGDGNWELAQKEVARIAQLIERAARKLLDETTPA